MSIAVRVDLADLIIKASYCLHNFLMYNFTLTYDATLKLRLRRMFSFLGFSAVLRMLVLISMRAYIFFPSLFCINFFIVISTINQPESRQRRNCQPITPNCFRTCQDVVRFKFFIRFDQNLNLLYR